MVRRTNVVLLKRDAQVTLSPRPFLVARIQLGNALYGTSVSGGHPAFDSVMRESVISRITAPPSGDGLTERPLNNALTCSSIIPVVFGYFCGVGLFLNFPSLLVILVHFAFFSTPT